MEAPAWMHTIEKLLGSTSLGHTASDRGTSMEEPDGDQSTISPKQANTVRVASLSATSKVEEMPIGKDAKRGMDGSFDELFDHALLESENDALFIDSEYGDDEKDSEDDGVVGWREKEKTKLPRQYYQWLKTSLEDEDCHAIRPLLENDKNDATIRDLIKPIKMPSSFDYHSFSDAMEGAIRLLVLWPAMNIADELECSLIHVSLTTPPLYNALSYAWGNTKGAKFPISLNGRTFHILYNLHAALVAIRSQSTKPITLWIDALCIDQSSHTESNTQVLLMRAVYSKAKRVIIWLGGEELYDFNDFAVWWVSKTGPTFPFIFLGPVAIIALGEFLDRPWFRRIWVIQEFALGQEPIFLCGKHSFSSQQLLMALDFLERNIRFRKHIPAEAGYLLRCISRIRSLYEHRDLKHMPSLLELLVKFRHCQASRSHDKIYGLLGLSKESPLTTCAPPKPDYDKPYKDVYKDWALFFIAEYRNLDVLHACRARDSDRNLPSWAPDWRVAHSSKRPNMLQVFQMWRATRDLESRYELLEEGRVLSVTGIKVEVLQKSNFVQEPEYYQELSFDSTRRDTAYQHICESLLSYYEGEPIETVNLFLKRSYYGRRHYQKGPNGRVAIVPNDANDSDVICILFGGKMPFVLRPYDERYEIIGDCYLEGCMEGQECYEYDSNGNSRVQTFKIR